MTDSGTSSTGIKVDWTSEDDWKAMKPEPYIVLDGASDDLKFEYDITGLEELKKYTVELVFKPDLNYKYIRQYIGNEFRFKGTKGLSMDYNKETHSFTHQDGWTTGEKWMSERVNFNHVIFKKLPMREGATRQQRKPKENELHLATGWKYQVAVKITKEGEQEIVYEKDVPGQFFIGVREMGRERETRESGGEQSGGPEPSTSQVTPGDSQEGSQPSVPVSEIEVKWVSKEGWGAEDAHIVLNGPSEILKFQYDIKGLEKSAEYKVELVFMPDSSERYQRRKIPGQNAYRLPKVNTSSSGINKDSHAVMHNYGWITGERWMSERVDFKRIFFKKFPSKPGGEPLPKRRNADELCLAAGWKYQVAVRITKQDVGIVYEKEVPDQAFVSCGPAAPVGKSSEAKRESGGERRQELEGDPESSQASTSQATPVYPEVHTDSPSQQASPYSAETGSPGSSRREDSPPSGSSSHSAFTPYRKVPVRKSSEAKRESGGEVERRQELEGDPESSQASTSQPTLLYPEVNTASSSQQASPYSAETRSPGSSLREDSPSSGSSSHSAFRPYRRPP